MPDILGKMKQAFFGNPQPPSGAAQPAVPIRSTPLQGGGPTGQPSDFFPSTVGTRWSFNIEVSGDPLRFCQIAWPAGNGQIGVQTRGRFPVVLSNRSRRNFGFTMSVASAAPSQGPLQYPGGVELAIENDE